MPNTYDNNTLPQNKISLAESFNRAMKKINEKNLRKHRILSTPTNTPNLSTPTNTPKLNKHRPEIL